MKEWLRKEITVEAGHSMAIILLAIAMLIHALLVH